MAAAADLLAGRPAEVFCQARDALSHDVRECRRGLTLTAWWALEVLHLPRGALLLQSMFSASNPSRLAPANARFGVYCRAASRAIVDFSLSTGGKEGGNRPVVAVVYLIPG